MPLLSGYGGAVKSLGHSYFGHSYFGQNCLGCEPRVASALFSCRPHWLNEPVVGLEPTT